MNEKRAKESKELFEREQYLRNHPEIPGLISLMKLELLRDKPENIELYLSDIFFASHNRENLESALGMSLQK